MKSKLTVHHLVPRSKWWSNESINKVRLPNITHVNLHRFFSNDTPVEQIERVLKFNDKCLSDEFIKEVAKVLDGWYDDWVYENWVFRK